jgi:hypothetical protein
MLLAATVAQAGEPIDSTFERLAKVDTFAFGPTGHAGVISQGEKDYRLILSRPSAIADFERLVSAGNPQAKSYALVGIRVLNVNRFKELSHSFRDSKEEVVTQIGCIIFDMPFKAVLDRIEAGEYSKGK